MPWFKVLVGGEHLLIAGDDGARCMGLFAARHVEAPTSELASERALEVVRGDAAFLQLLLNSATDPPHLFVEDCHEITHPEVPDVEPGYALFAEDALNLDMGAPPYLVIRPAVSFWVEHRRIDDWTATPQAVRDGCFVGARIWDADGELWNIEHADCAQPPSLVHRLMPWRQVRLKLAINRAPKPTLQDVKQQLVAVIESGNSFVEQLRGDRAMLLASLHAAPTPAELSGFVSRCLKRA